MLRSRHKYCPICSVAAQSVSYTAPTVDMVTTTVARAGNIAADMVICGQQVCNSTEVLTFMYTATQMQILFYTYKANIDVDKTIVKFRSSL